MTILKKTLLFVSCSSLLLCASINISVAVTRAEYDDVQAYTMITPPTSREGCSEFSSTVYYGDSYFNVEGKILQTALEDSYSYESNEYDDPNTYINDFFARRLPYQEE